MGTEPPSSTTDGGVGKLTERRVYLAHAAFGLVGAPDGGPPALTVGDLPSEFVALPDDEQEMLMEKFLLDLANFLRSIGADRLVLHVYLNADAARLASLGLVFDDQRRAEAPYSPALFMSVFRELDPQHLYVLSGEQLLLAQYDTWDTIKVLLTPAEYAVFASR